MPFHRIAGTFHVTGYQPDGDTIRFAPSDPTELAALEGRPAKVNARGHVSLRLEGIDTLETHFEGLRQPAPHADGATDALIAHLGIANVVWARERRSIVSSDDAVPGHILTRATDKFGRVVAFAFPGGTTSNPAVFLSPAGLEPSANMALVRAGLAYPTFYSGLFADLRAAVADASSEAREAARGLTPVDRTETGARVVTLASLTDDEVVMPKLFRRATAYMRETGTIRGFKAAMEANAEPVLDLREMNFTHLDSFIEEEGEVIRLSRSPAELVFDPMPERMGTDFEAVLAAAAEEMAPAGRLESGAPRPARRLPEPGEDSTFRSRVAAMREALARV